MPPMPRRCHAARQRHSADTITPPLIIIMLADTPPLLPLFSPFRLFSLMPLVAADAIVFHTPIFADAGFH
jgi:hypothetical protein